MTPVGGPATLPAGGEGRRELTYAALFCLAGGGLALWAVTRTWAVELTDRPAPLSGLWEVRSGGDLLPWLPPLAVVGLAGAGAVLATRGRVRRLLGGLLLAIGLAVAVGGGYGLLAGLDGEVSRHWPALCLAGGLLTAVGGALTSFRGQRWPTMGGRYERPTRVGTATATGGGAGAGVPAAGRQNTDAWDALDRGEDPTVS